MPQRGRKPDPKQQKMQRGTVQPCRDQFDVLEAPDGEVRPPEGMGDRALLVWSDYVDVVKALGTVKPADADSFGHWCQMTADIRESWQSGEVVPASFVQQWRTLGEMFGLCGEKSRMVAKPADDKPKGKFSRNGHRARS